MEQQPRLFELPEEPKRIASHDFQRPESSAVMTPPDSLTALQQRREVISDIIDIKRSFGYGRTIDLEEERDEIDRQIRELSQPKTVSATPEVSRSVVSAIAHLVPPEGVFFREVPKRKRQSPYQRRFGKKAV